MIDTDAVWFVTGSSRGLGRAIAKQALAAGYRLVATARRTADVEAMLATHPDRALAIALDVTDPAQAAAAVAVACERFGGIDVLVNNAGYGYFAAIEEGDDAGVRAMWETDVFGPVNVLKAALPGMREAGHGHVVNIGSVGGLVTFPAVGYYHMAKFAIEALSETLAKELSPFGIGVTVVEPGAFRTDFRGNSGRQSPIRLPAYAATAGKARDRVLAGHGQQQGDPTRGARAIIAAVQAENPPLHLAIGSDALGQIRDKLAALAADLDAWEEVTRGTDFAA